MKRDGFKPCGTQQPSVRLCLVSWVNLPENVLYTTVYLRQKLSSLGERVTVLVLSLLAKLTWNEPGHALPIICGSWQRSAQVT